jgi:hypothetical protein
VNDARQADYGGAKCGVSVQPEGVEFGAPIG